VRVRDRDAGRMEMTEKKRRKKEEGEDKMRRRKNGRKALGC